MKRGAEQKSLGEVFWIFVIREMKIYIHVHRIMELLAFWCWCGVLL